MGSSGGFDDFDFGDLGTDDLWDDTAGGDEEFGDAFGLGNGGSSSSGDAFGSGLGNGGNGGDAFGQSTNTSGQQIDNSRLEGAFDVSNQYDNTNGTNGDSREVKKMALIFIGVGVVLLIIVFIIAGVVGKKNQNAVNDNTGNTGTNVAVQPSNVQSDPNEILKSNGNNFTSSSSSAAGPGNLKWSEIPGDEIIENVSEDFQPNTFLITSVKHYARTVDSDNNLVIKTVLTGAINGLNGSYTLEVPYDKGRRISVGGSLNVYCRLGTYNGKTVLVELRYEE